MKQFEEDMIGLIPTIEMRRHENRLQRTMREDIVRIRDSPNIIISADKTGNLYEIQPEDYKKYLKNSITSNYKRAGSSLITSINSEAADIAKKLELEDRIEAMSLNEAFISVKDHKRSFGTDIPDFRLLNPSKTKLGKVSKQILERVNREVRDKLCVNQWRSTEDMLKWFKELPDKENLKFIQFDIESFYPSISEALLRKAIEMAREYTVLTEEEEGTIIHARRAVLVDNDGAIWEKTVNPNFDITMGAYDGAECCELVGLYLLKGMLKIVDRKEGGLYRDDGLLAVRGRGQAVNKKKKDLIKFFQ